MTVSSPVVEAFVRNVPELELIAEAVQRADQEAASLHVACQTLAREAAWLAINEARTGQPSKVREALLSCHALLSDLSESGPLLSLLGGGSEE